MKNYLVYTMSGFQVIEEPTPTIKECMTESDIHQVADVYANNPANALQKGIEIIKEKNSIVLSFMGEMIVFSNKEEMNSFFTGIQFGLECARKDIWISEQEIANAIKSVS